MNRADLIREAMREMGKAKSPRKAAAAKANALKATAAAKAAREKRKREQ